MDSELQKKKAKFGLLFHNYWSIILLTLCFEISNTDGTPLVHFCKRRENAKKIFWWFLCVFYEPQMTDRVKLKARDFLNVVALHKSDRENKAKPAALCYSDASGLDGIQQVTTSCT